VEGGGSGAQRRGEFGNQRRDLGSATRTRGAFKIWAEKATVESSLAVLAAVLLSRARPRAVCSRPRRRRRDWIWAPVLSGEIQLVGRAFERVGST
jgi:hypothetical protein